jgi:hypothetical protein
VRKRQTAEELVEELTRDPQYARRIALQDAAYERRQERLKRDETVIVADLQAAGERAISSVWDLVERGTLLHEAVVRVLLEHLAHRHLSWTRETIARALAWAPLGMVGAVAEGFSRERDDPVRSMLALAVTDIAIREADVERGATVVSALLKDPDADTRSIVVAELANGGAVDFLTENGVEGAPPNSEFGGSKGAGSDTWTSVGIDLADAARLVALIAALPGYETIQTLQLPGHSHRLMPDQAITVNWIVQGDALEVELFKDDVDAIDISISGPAERVLPIDELFAAFIE